MNPEGGGNHARIWIRAIGMVAIAVMVLVPPWEVRYQVGGETRVQGAGYHPIWNAPLAVDAPDPEAEEVTYRVRMTWLGIQLGVVLVAMNGLIYGLRTKTPGA